MNRYRCRCPGPRTVRASVHALLGSEAASPQPWTACTVSPPVQRIARKRSVPAHSGHRSRLRAQEQAVSPFGWKRCRPQPDCLGVSYRAVAILRQSVCPPLGVHRAVIRDKSNIYKNNRQCRLIPRLRPRRLGLRAHLPHRAGGSGDEQSGFVTPVAGVRSLPPDDKLSANVALTRSKSGNPRVSLIPDALISTRTGSWIERQVT